MMTNSFGNQKYMQPMGRLKACTRGTLIFFLLSFGWVGGSLGGGGGAVDGVRGGIFSFSLCSQHFPFKFPICSQSSQCVPNSTSLYSVCFAQSPPLLACIGGPKGEALNLSIESSILREPA